MRAARSRGAQRSRFVAAFVLAGSIFGAGFVSGCTTSMAGAGPEVGQDGGADVLSPDAADGAQLDATVDASPDSGDGAIEAAPPPCDGLLCNGTCLHTSDCSTCAGAPLLCRSKAQCVAACSSCDGPGDAAAPVECFACDSTHANPIGTCESAQSSYCLGGDYFGGPAGTGYHCDCPSGDAGDCPGSQQVCFDLNGQHLCATCGEPIPLNATGGTTCKAPGTTCNASAQTCN